MTDLANLPGTQLPGSTYVVSADDDRRYAEVVASTPATDGTVDPLWGFLGALTGTGLGIEGLFALADCDVERDGPMLGGFDLELDRQLHADVPYRVDASVLSLDRKAGRSGTFDLMRVRATLSDEGGVAATCTTTYVVPRDRTGATA